MIRCGVVILGIGSVVFSANLVSAEPTRQEFIDYVISTASFLEQCAARNIVETNDVQNEVLKMAKALGFFDGDYWTPLQRGAGGVVYDILRQKWIRMQFGPEACKLTLSEQNKVQASLARYF